VFDGYERTKSSDAELEQRGKQKETEVQSKRDELKKLSDGLELLSDDARDARARHLEEKRDELQRFVNSTARDLRHDRDRIAKEILQEIQTAIEAYAKAKGFSVVLDDRSLLYGQPAYDVTDDVLTLLNSRQGKPR
jgi:outer membrane protein